MIKRISLFLVVVFAIAFFVPGNPVHACTQPPPPTPGGPTVTPVTLLDRVNRAPIIFVGRVVEAGDYTQPALIDVELYLKGDGETRVQVRGFGDSSMCLASVQDGSRYIFFAQPETDLLRGIYFEGYTPVMNPSDENIDAIVALTGQSDATFLDKNDDIITDDDGTAILWIGAGVGVLILIGSLFIIMRDPRKKKAKRG